jgi:type IV pilus assembly protein PilY1
MRNTNLRLWIAVIALNMLNLSHVVEAATVTLATSPLANATASVVRPNIMYLLDNSGSMDWDYLPDYAAAGSSGTGSSICWNGINDSNSRTTCKSATDAAANTILSSTQMTGSSVQIPLLTSTINYLYYNPSTYYQPPFNADGSAYPNSTPSAAFTNGFAASGSYNLATTVIKKGTASLGSTSVTLDSTSGLAIGMMVAGPGIDAGTFLTTTSNPGTLSKPTITAISGANISFTSGAYPHQAYCSSSGPTTLQTYSAAGASTSVVSRVGKTTNSDPNITGIIAPFTTGLYVGMGVTGTGIASGTTILAIPSATTLVLSDDATSTGSNRTLTFTPSCVETADTTSDSNSLYPSSVFSSAKSYTGVPYYYIMSPMEYCKDATFATCQSTADAVYSVPAIYRWCNAYSTSSKTYSDCQDLRNATHTIPDYLGGYSTTPIAAVQASASLTISSYVPGKSITGLKVNSTNIIGGTTFVAGNAGLTSVSGIASVICTTIHTNTASSGYDCTATTGGQLTIKANAPPAHTTYTTPNGYVVTVGGPPDVTGTAATGTITLNSTTGPTVIQDVKIGGASVLTTTPVNFANGTATTANAATLAGLIGNGFSATSSGNTITITSSTLGTAIGSAIAITSTAITGVRPSATLTLTAANTTATAVNITAGTNSTCSTGITSLASANTSTATTGTSCGTNALSRASNTLNNLYGGSTTTSTTDWLDSFGGIGSCSTTLTYQAPVGSTFNGRFFCAKFTSTTGVTTSNTGTFSGGVNAASVQSTSTSGTMTGTMPAGVIATSPASIILAGGVDNAAAGRVRTGKFTRVDILPSTTFPAKSSDRKDCAGTTCTYAEELQNFANWFSYYRTRLSLMKTTSTLAFNKLDSKYRVGFDLLSHYSQPKKIDVEVAQFVDSGGEVANQRTKWWSNLTGATTSGSTPLRSSLMKMGKYYAGKLTNGITTPAFGGTKAIGTIQVNSTTKNTAQITSLTIGSAVILDPGVDAPFIVSSCTGSGTPKSCSTTNLTSVATALLSAIKSASGYTASNYVATSSGTKITFTAKTVGDGPNGEDIQVSTAVNTISLAVIDVGGGKNATPLIPPAVIEPLQYSCQQNFTLLVTDGYWNSDQYDDLTQLDGSTLIGNQDNNNSGLTARPTFDGAVSATAPCSDSSFSSCGTLADIAMYYYKTDLRDSSQGNTVSGATGLDVSTNNVFKSSTDSNQNQHMVLFTMGLGAPGTLRYTGDYATATSGDFKNIVNGPANWPAVKANDPTTIDDLWHAAVNGRGKYFSARDPDSVVKGLGDALASIDVREGAAAAAATSNLQPVAGDNFAYVASYTTNEWSGDLQARVINTTSGKVSDPANIAPNDCVGDSGCPWSAKKKLDALDWNSRKVYMASSSGAPLRAFNYSNLTATEQTYFNPAAGIAAYGTGPLSQYGSVSAAHPSEITASKMVDFLRGDRCLEEGNTCTDPAVEIWRGRTHVMGDVVNTQPTFVRAPSATYQDTGYSAFLTAKASREGVVYVSGNDGMLHAFAAGDFADASVTGGTEIWSFIPTATLPYLRYLADTDYVHRYFVDGQITVADVNFGGGASDWHTILVGGLGGGGQAYYALDITDPLNPKYLWEFTHPNLGSTYGNISINKLPSGEWAVLFSSGYNNADGKGYLYAVNPQTGALRSGFPISNGSGTASSPSNLGKVAAWVDNLEANNTATQIYAGDMDGDLWRFDLAAKTAFKLAHLVDGSNNPQPITTRPEMTLNDGLRIIYIGTGRYLGDLDPPDTSVQSFYAFADTLGAANLGGGTQVTWNPRTDNNSGTPVFLLRKLIALKDDGSQITRVNSFGNTVEARQICTGAGSAVSSSTGKCISETGGIMDWTSSGGWYFDFPDTGERVNVDMNLTLGTLTIPSNVPASSACTSGGYGWVNYIDFKTGLEIDSTLIVSEKIANALIVGLNVIKVGDKLVAIVTTSDFKHDATEPPGAPGKFKGKRDLWRELDPYQ